MIKLNFKVKNVEDYADLRKILNQVDSIEGVEGTACNIWGKGGLISVIGNYNPSEVYQTLTSNGYPILVSAITKD